MVICFEGGDYSDYTDSISLKKYCVEEIFELRGNKKNDLLNGNAQCDIRLTLSSQTIPQASFIEKGFPNPAQEQVTIRFGIAESGPVRIVLFDARGSAVAVVSDATYMPGIYELQMETTVFKSGLYYISFTSHGLEAVEPVTIVR